ncbi:MAG: hypothetical protein FWC53_04375 [Firmicutes bacterium]|nr:hypothetical protein [Bacillota bacterium]
MENAAEAIKYAFAIMVFVISISIAFMSISQAKATSDVITFAIDKTNFYPQLTRDASGELKETYGSTTNGTGIKTDLKGNRIVGVDTVVSSLYRYYTEGFCVIINDKNEKRIAKFDPEGESKSPWNGSNQNKVKRINAFLSGVVPSDGINGNKVGFGGISGQYTGGSSGYWSIAEKPFNTYIKNNATFIEEFVEVNYTGNYLTGTDGSNLTVTSGNQKIFITYTEV